MERFKSWLQERANQIIKNFRIKKNSDVTEISNLECKTLKRSHYSAEEHFLFSGTRMKYFEKDKKPPTFRRYNSSAVLAIEKVVG